MRRCSNPIVDAKQMATVDLLSQGRFGLNLVCGWNQDEFEMFGTEQREHDERYAFGEDWLTVVRTIWREADRDRLPRSVLRLAGTLSATPSHTAARSR